MTTGVKIQKGEEEEAIRDILKIEVGAYGQDVLKLVRFKDSEEDVWSAAYRSGETICACVVLTYWDDEWFHMKVMAEEMGPLAADVPLEVLDLLTPTENDYANEWRESCRTYAYRVSDEPSRFEDFENNDFTTREDEHLKASTGSAFKETSKMKPVVICFNGDFLSGPELSFDGKNIAQDTREAMRFATLDDALAYIDENREALKAVGSDPRPQWRMPVGHTHH